MSSSQIPVRPKVSSFARDLADRVQHKKRILLSGPVRPDEDSVGACLALARGIRFISSAHVDVAGDLLHEFSWLPETDTAVPDAEVTSDYDMVIVLDGDKTRLVRNVDNAFAAAQTKGIVDHHISTDINGYDIVLLDPTAASTCDLVYEILLSWNCPLDADTACLLYAGLVYDTGGFRYLNTTPTTHIFASELLKTGFDHAYVNVKVLSERTRSGLRVMSHLLTHTEFLADGKVALGSLSLDDFERLGGQKGDTVGIIDALLFTQGVIVACIINEKSRGIDGSQPAVSISLRSRSNTDPEIDVSQLAQKMNPNGGGHARAAGAMVHETLDTVHARIHSVLLNSLEDAATS